MNVVIANAIAAVAGVVLAVVASFGIVASANETPEPVDEPLVTYGER